MIALFFTEPFSTLLLSPSHKLTVLVTDMNAPNRYELYVLEDGEKPCVPSLP
jgi:hypothetical protein